MTAPDLLTRLRAYLVTPADRGETFSPTHPRTLLSEAAERIAELEAGEVEVAWEVWENDDLMAASADSEADGRHYFAVYAQDGPMKLVRAETRRRLIARS